MNKHLEKDPHINFDKPVIDVFIYKILQNKILKTKNYIGNKFGKIYINKDEKGIIYPSEIKFSNKLEPFNKKKTIKNKSNTYSNIYSADILTSNVSNVSNLPDFLRNNQKNKSNTYSNIDSEDILTSNVSNVSNLPDFLRNNQKINTKYNIKHFYKLYLSGNSQKLTIQQINNTIINTINSAINNNITNIINNSEIYRDKSMGNYSTKYLDNIIKYTIPKCIDDKILIFGRIKNNFHSFFRILVRLHIKKIINLDNFKIANNYKLIFLGNIFDDKNKYNLEMLYILSKFIHTNNDKNNIKIIVMHDSNRSTKNNIINKFIEYVPHRAILTLKEYKYSLLSSFNINSYGTYDERNQNIKLILDLLEKDNTDFIISGYSEHPEELYVNVSLYGKNNNISLNDIQVQELNENNQYIEFPTEKIKFKNNNINIEINQCKYQVARIKTVGWLKTKNESTRVRQLYKIAREWTVGYLSKKSNVIINLPDELSEQVYPLLMLSNDEKLKKDSYIMLHIPNQNNTNQNT